VQILEQYLQNLIATEKNKFDMQYKNGVEMRKNETEFTHMANGLNKLWGYNDTSDLEDTCMFLPFMLFWEELIEIRQTSDDFNITEAEFMESTKLKRKRN